MPLGGGGKGPRADNMPWALRNVNPALTTGQRSFRYRAVGLWNSLDNELKKLPLETFKIKLKEFLLNRYFET
jgi:hypothetical protein